MRLRGLRTDSNLRELDDFKMLGLVKTEVVFARGLGSWVDEECVVLSLGKDASYRSLNFWVELRILKSRLLIPKHPFIRSSHFSLR